VKTKIATLALLIASQASYATSVNGVIRDESGMPVAGASVDVVGTHITVRVDAEGRFQLDNPSARNLELHVKAPGFSHKIISVDSTASSDINLVLDRSVMEVISVIGLPWHASNIESAQPVNVLGDEELRRRQSSTLGDTLKFQVGVHSSYYGPVASSPIIRGLEGPRVQITQNGLDAGDASRVGPDHAVATEASTARQIEILRGPATLFYGSGAIGGVVNIVDDRVPQSSDTEGEWRIEHNSVANDKLVSGSVTTGAGDVAVHLDGFWRDADNYKMPGDYTGDKRLNNSATDAKGMNIGASYLLDNGFVGLSYGRLERTYGIPGHSHGDEDVPVHADLVQDRFQLISELTLDNDFFSSVNTRFGYTDYHHDEVELDEIATTFSNKTYEARVDVFHHPIADWRGAMTLHYKRNDFSASGIEAFTPPSLTETWALGVIEERHFGPVLVQLGARLENTEISADRLIADLSRYEEHLLSVYEVEHRSKPFSVSAGAVWDFAQGYNLGISLTHAQRTPSSAELLSYGPHIGSGLFEVGALLQVQSLDNGGYRLDLNRGDVKLEKSNNIDISLRKFEGNFGFLTNIFYNAIDNYYYLGDTGFTRTIFHEHGDHSHAGELPLYAYVAQDANLYGFEGEFFWQYSAPLKFTLLTDYVRGELKEGGDLPRIPPLRIGGRVEWNIGNVDLEVSASHYLKQNRTAALESETNGYTLLDMQATWNIGHWLPGASLYLKGNNLTDEYAQVHSSFLKDIAPLPGRAITVGISGKF